jgi:hypothetical protein
MIKCLKVNGTNFNLNAYHEIVMLKSQPSVLRVMYKKELPTIGMFNGPLNCFAHSTLRGSLNPNLSHSQSNKQIEIME